MATPLNVLLLGGTDLTLAVGEAVERAGATLAGVAFVGERFDISYRPDGVRNARAVDVAGWCQERDCPPHEYRDVDSLAEFAAQRQADFALAAGWYHMVPAGLRSAFSRGCAGLHASLLPKLRGGAPLGWAIITGEERTGITLFELGDGVDDGPVFGQREFPVGPRAQVGELVVAAERAAIELVEETLPLIAEGRVVPRPQEGSPTWCLQRSPDDGRIDWSHDVGAIDRLIRASGRPYPGAFTELDGDRMTIWRAHPARTDLVVHGAYGQIARIADEPGPCVVTGGGVLTIDEATTSADGDAMALLGQAGNRRLT